MEVLELAQAVCVAIKDWRAHESLPDDDPNRMQARKAKNDAYDRWLEVYNQAQGPSPF